MSMKNLGEIDTIGKAWITVLTEILNNGKKTLYNIICLSIPK